jgi:hypothetical protein
MGFSPQFTTGVMQPGEKTDDRVGSRIEKSELGSSSIIFRFRLERAGCFKGEV